MIAPRNAAKRGRRVRTRDGAPRDAAAAGGRRPWSRSSSWPRCFPPPAASSCPRSWTCTSSASTRARWPKAIRSSTTPASPPPPAPPACCTPGILAAAHRAGFRGEGLIAFAILSGVALYLATVKMARDVRRPPGRPPRGMARGRAGRAGRAGGLGLPLRRRHRAVHVPRPLWLLALAARGLAAGAVRPVAAPAVLVALTPPGGPSAGRPPRRRLAARAGAARPRRRGACCPGRRGRRAAGARRTTARSPAPGSGRPLADKSLFANFGIPASLGIVAEYGVDVIRGLLLGFYPSSATIGFNRGWAALCFPPLGLLLIAAAALRTPSVGDAGGAGPRRCPRGAPAAPTMFRPS